MYHTIHSQPLSQLPTWSSVPHLSITHPSNHSRLCLSKCHLTLAPDRPGLTPVQHTTLHTTATQPPSPNQWHILLASNGTNCPNHSIQLGLWPPRPHQHLHPHSAHHLGSRTYPILIYVLAVIFILKALLSIPLKTALMYNLVANKYW